MCSSPTRRRTRGPGLLILAVVLTLAGGCAENETPTPEGVDAYLTGDWDRYAEQYLREPGYVVDPARADGRVTSEGQGYALLRTSLLGRGEAFGRIFRWTEQHLRRPDGLYSWLWSPADSAVVDPNTATDADQEIALALLIAADRFDRDDYRQRARTLLSDIRSHEAVDLPDGWFPAAGNWAVGDRIVNLSYFLPYAYPHFDRADPDGNWDAALAAGYRLLDRWLERPGARLPPDFMSVDSAGRPHPASTVDTALSGFFSFDAVRIYWRVAVDCLLHDRERACSGPSRSEFLARELDRSGRIVTRYTTGGERRSEQESLSFYGSLLPSLRLHHPSLYSRVRRTSLSAESLRRLSEQEERYYDRNWVWFGIAAASGWLESRMP